VKTLTSIDIQDPISYFARHLEDNDAVLKFARMCQSYSQTFLDSQNFWIEESQTWLLFSLLSITLPSSNLPQNFDLKSPKAVLESFMKNNHLMSRLLKVKEWLELIAPVMLPAEERKCPIPMFTSMDEGKRSRIPSFDPDSIGTSIGQQLVDPKDKDYEEAQLKTVYELLRRGKFQEAIAWCLKVDQGWRAGILSGGIAFSDSKLDSSVFVRDVSGNPNRILWKENIYHLLKDPALSKYERAIYSVVVGDFLGMATVASDWKDLLWASIVSMIEMGIDQVLHDTSFGPSPEDIYGSLANAFREIESSRSNFGQFYPIIKAMILEADLGEAIFNCFAKKNDDAFLRFAANLVIISAGNTTQSEYHDILVHSYLSSLAARNAGIEHYALYCSKLLSESFKVDTFVSFLDSISGRPRDCKWTLLAEAKSYGLPLDLITVKVTQAQFAVDPTSVYLFDWLLFDEKQMRGTIFELMTLQIRCHLTNNDYKAAQLVFQSIPAPIYSNRDVLKALLSEPNMSPFVKEITYYRHLLHILEIYEEWSVSYASYNSSNSEVVLQELVEKSIRFNEQALSLLKNNWLSDVELPAGINLIFMLSGQREAEMDKLRISYLSDIILIMMSIFMVAKMPDDLILETLETIVNPELGLLAILEQEGQLNNMKSKLDTLLLNEFPKDIQERLGKAYFVLIRHCLK
jgi:hypothetical protein